MIAALVCLVLAADGPMAPKPVAPSTAHTTTFHQREAAEDQAGGEAPGVQLAAVRRIYVDVLSGGESAVQLRDLLITSLEDSKLFVITEDEDRADAVLRGSGADTTFTDVFTSSDSIGTQLRTGKSSNQGNGRGYGSSGSRSSGIGLNESESQHSEERKHEAIATVRLVNRDGDVIWAITEESLGAKFKGASADVADRIAKRLALDYRKARAASETSKPNP